MRTLFDAVNFEHCTPIPRYNSSGYNLTNKKDGIALIFVPKENYNVSAGSVTKDFDYSDTTLQWFNAFTGEFSAETPYEYKRLYHWDSRPWRGRCHPHLTKSEAQEGLITKADGA